MEFTTKEVIQLAVQGGTGILVFVLFLVTFKQLNETLKEAFSKHACLTSELMQIVKDDQEYKLHMAGVLDRLVIKLENPVKCPMSGLLGKIKLEVPE